MQRSRMSVGARSRFLVGGALLVVLLAAGCGPLGNDGENPATPQASPIGGQSTLAASPSAIIAISDLEDSQQTPTPKLEPTSLRNTPTAGVPQVTVPPVKPSDGATSGDVDNGGTAVPTPRPTPPVVEGCVEPDPLPERISSGRRVPVDTVRVREFPGVECAEIGRLEPGQIMTFVAGRVRTQTDEYVWVKIQADTDGDGEVDVTGWVAEEFIVRPTPAPEA